MVVVTGDIFIVPNTAPRLGEVLSEFARSAITADLAECGLKPAGRLVEVWYTSPDCGNWTDHVWDLHPEFTGGREDGGVSSPGRLPEHVLWGVKEGDEIVLNFSGKELRLTAKQLNYRYRRFGKFEEVFEKLTR